MRAASIHTVTISKNNRINFYHENFGFISSGILVNWMKQGCTLTRITTPKNLIKIIIIILESYLKFHVFLIQSSESCYMTTC